MAAGAREAGAGDRRASPPAAGTTPCQQLAASTAPHPWTPPRQRTPSRQRRLQCPAWTWRPATQPAAAGRAWLAGGIGGTRGSDSRGSNGSSTTSSSSGSSKGAQPSRRESGPTWRPRGLPPGLACLEGGPTLPCTRAGALPARVRMARGPGCGHQAHSGQLCQQGPRATAQLGGGAGVHSADNLPAELRAALRGHFAVCLPQATAPTYGPGDEAGGSQPST